MRAMATFAPRVLRIRARTYALLVGGLVLATVGVAGVFVGAACSHGALGAIMALVLFGGLAAGVIGIFGALAAVLEPRWRERDATIGAQGGYVTIDDVGARVSGVRVEEDTKRARWAVAVFTGSRHPAVFAYLPTREEADAFAAAASPSLTDAVSSFRFSVGATRAGALATGTMFAGMIAVGLLHFAAKVPAPLALLALAPALVLYLIPFRATVGADGIALRWVWGTTFVPFSEVVDARMEGLSLVLSMRGRKPLRLLQAARNDENARLALAALLERIAQHRASGAASIAGLRARLDIPMTDRDAWTARLRAIAADAYRDAAITPEHLWDVLGDPASNETARIAAGALLRSKLDAAGVGRLRAVAWGAASPSLRAALERLAEDADPLGPLPRSDRG